MSNSHTTPRLRVAICGGGIGGLTLALALARTQDIAIDVYESNSAFAEIGAGIVLRDRSIRFLSELGIRDEVSALNGGLEGKGEPGPALSYFRADKPEAEVITNYYKTGVAMLHRAQFHNILFRHVQERVGMHTTKRLISYTDPENKNFPVRLAFADGSEATCDILIGADGFRSTVRTILFNGLADATQDPDLAKTRRDSVPPRFSGAVLYRVVIPSEKLKLPSDYTGWNLGKLYVGDDMFLVTYPLAQGRLLNAVIATLDISLEGIIHPQPWVSVASAVELKPMLEHAAPEARETLLAIEGLEVKKWVVNVVPPLDEWSAGRVALLGDAAHAMVPFQGAGAGQAIEDAQVLSALLGHPRASRATIQHVFNAYTEVRKPIATQFYHASRENGVILGNPDQTVEESAAKLQKLADDVWYTGRRPEDDVQDAMSLFEAAVIGATT